MEPYKRILKDVTNQTSDKPGEIYNTNNMDILEKQEVQEVQKIENIEIEPTPGEALTEENTIGIEPSEIKPIEFESDKEIDEMLKSHNDPNPEIKEIRAEQSAGDSAQKKDDAPGAVGVDISMFITPRLIIIIYDKIYPSILTYIARNFLKLDVNKKINLDDDEIELLEPIVAEMIKGISMKMNPFTAFLICSNFFYVSKLMEAPKVEGTDQDTKPKKKKRGRPRKVIISNGL
jgi:hypothetical protein